MNRIDATFQKLRENGKSAFVAYICAGDPSLEKTVEIAHTLEVCGVDVLELGVPFSDPIADGVVNQMAAERALKAGASLAGVLECVRTIRKTSQMPLVLMAYLNPIYTYGFDRFYEDAAAAGVDGVLLLDMTPEEQPLNADMQVGSQLRLIRLIAPTTPPARAASIAGKGEGFIYYVSREGVTGVQESLAEGLAEQVSAVRQAASAPVVVGFGISRPEQAATVASCSDGVIVGSAIVRIVEKHGDSPALLQELSDFVKPLVEATKSVHLPHP